ncbi:hypothetical protein [Wenjunlia tyrosinilytica]|jgi:hypothetical protein|uniref:Uncharacterized protein n=1 Tax=Wenjunlia tyrosinilytica TaxID=1544741 RepID=A0A917ZXT1_9ACTN|nr:hypothetical protein [Wenjunlia tyrosinilytica]GGO97567.1 hypothetical protein GCM10012280_59670 [Wenjunlia tyrosinilytica]
MLERGSPRRRSKIRTAIELVVLMVHDANADAVRLYEKLGTDRHTTGVAVPTATATPRTAVRPLGHR